VDDDVRLKLVHDARDRWGVTDVDRLQPEVRITSGSREVRALAGLRIERVEVIDDRYSVAIGQQPIDEVRPDESGTAGDECAHERIFLPW
jgi:hypothetical protein